MSEVYTSRVFACMARLYTLYSAGIWTPHPTTGVTPSVYFGGVDEDDQTQEAVILLGSPEQPPDIDWATVGATRADETFVLRTRIVTEVASLAQNDQGIDLKVFNRLSDLADIAQRQLRDTVTGRPIGGFSMSDSFDCSCTQWRVMSPQPSFYLTESGVGGLVDIDAAFVARI